VLAEQQFSSEGKWHFGTKNFYA